MGRNYIQELREQGRLEQVNREIRDRELRDLMSAWSYAREEVRAEFLVWAGVWEALCPDPDSDAPAALADDDLATLYRQVTDALAAAAPGPALEPDPGPPARISPALPAIS
jgi:hypothetical protein